MDASVAVSLVSAAVAVVGIYLSTRAARLTARISYEFELAKSKATKEQQVEEIMSRYREPLLLAAFDLQSRIYNIIEQDFLIRYGTQGRGHERKYVLDNTLFLFAEYFGWVEIVRRDVQFLDLGDVERNRLLVERLEKVTFLFATDRETDDPTFRIFRGEQRALGELMIPGSADADARRQCIGYVHFCRQLRDSPTFQEWFQPLSDDILTLSANRTIGHDRLIHLQHALIDLIDFLDDPPTRFLAQYRSKLVLRCS